LEVILSYHQPKFLNENRLYPYFLCGLKVESEISFPELAIWRGPTAAPAEITITLGSVEPLIAPDCVAATFQTQGNSLYILDLKRVGRILVADGKRIVCQPIKDVDPERVRLNLIGTVQSVLWHQRGLLPLHASTVQIAAAAVAIAGATGSGKSVLAGAFARLGFTVLSDDFAVLKCEKQQTVLLPGYPKIRLWADARDALGMQAQTVAAAHPVLAKYVVDALCPIVEEPVALSDVVVISSQRAQPHRLERLRGAEAFAGLLSVVHTPEAARALGRHHQIFEAINHLISQRVRVWSLFCPDDLGRLIELPSAIVAQLADAPADGPA
jgi:hypothetical protein